MRLSEVDTLIKEAEDAMRLAITPYSRFGVGAALMAESGMIYRGCNIENPSLLLSFCAERSALIKALTEGEKAFKSMAVVSSDGGYCFPCGSCRQMLAEFAPGIALYLASLEGIKKYSISELLPNPFKKL